MSAPGADRRLIIRRGEWPGPDRAAWDRLFVEGDILDGVGPCHHWAEGSRKKREQTYGHWLGFCADHNVVCPPHDVTARASVETVKAFIELERARCSPRTAFMHADHAQYLATWLSVLKADKKAIFTAASKASEAAAFLAAFQEA